MERNTIISNRCGNGLQHGRIVLLLVVIIIMLVLMVVIVEWMWMLLHVPQVSIPR